MNLIKIHIAKDKDPVWNNDLIDADDYINQYKLLHKLDIFFFNAQFFEDIIKNMLFSIVKTGQNI